MTDATTPAPPTADPIQVGPLPLNKSTIVPSPEARYFLDRKAIQDSAQRCALLLQQRGYVVVVKEPHDLYQPGGAGPIPAVEIMLINPETGQGQPTVMTANLCEQMEAAARETPTAAVAAKLIVATKGLAFDPAKMQ